MGRVIALFPAPVPGTVYLEDPDAAAEESLPRAVWVHGVAIDDDGTLRWIVSDGGGTRLTTSAEDVQLSLTEPQSKQLRQRQRQLLEAWGQRPKKTS